MPIIRASIRCERTIVLEASIAQIGRRESLLGELVRPRLLLRMDCSHCCTDHYVNADETQDRIAE